MIDIQFQLKHFREMVATLRRINDLHAPQEITLPDGSWGTNCRHCDGWEFPCATIYAMIGREQ